MLDPETLLNQDGPIRMTCDVDENNQIFSDADFPNPQLSLKTRDTQDSEKYDSNQIYRAKSPSHKVEARHKDPEKAVEIALDYIRKAYHHRTYEYATSWDNEDEIEGIVVYEITHVDRTPLFSIGNTENIDHENTPTNEFNFMFWVNISQEYREKIHRYIEKFRTRMPLEGYRVKVTNELSEPEREIIAHTMKYCLYIYRENFLATEVPRFHRFMSFSQLVTGRDVQSIGELCINRIIGEGDNINHRAYVPEGTPEISY